MITCDSFSFLEYLTGAQICKASPERNGGTVDDWQPVDTLWKPGSALWLMGGEAKAAQQLGHQGHALR